MTKEQFYEKYVHTFEQDKKTLYSVCVWDNCHNQWVSPLSKAEQRLNPGAYSWFSKKLSGIGGYKTLTVAKKNARELFSETWKYDVRH